MNIHNYPEKLRQPSVPSLSVRWVYPPYLLRIRKNFQDMEVSWNRGTPKSSSLEVFSMINHPFWGYPHLWEPPLFQTPEGPLPRSRGKPSGHSRKPAANVLKPRAMLQWRSATGFHGHWSSSLWHHDLMANWVENPPCFHPKSNSADDIPKTIKKKTGSIPMISTKHPHFIPRKRLWPSNCLVSSSTVGLSWLPSRLDWGWNHMQKDGQKIETSIATLQSKIHAEKLDTWKYHETWWNMM